MTEFTFPAPLPTDSDDVLLALNNARSHWEAADHSEAAAWLRKAAAAAEEAGSDLRAVALAQCATDLESTFHHASADPQYLQAIRVAVKRSVRDGELFVARLIENQPIPQGSHEAFLVLTNPRADLFDSSAS